MIETTRSFKAQTNYGPLGYELTKMVPATNHGLTRDHRQMVVWDVKCDLSAPWVSNCLAKVSSSN